MSQQHRSTAAPQHRSPGTGGQAPRRAPGSDRGISSSRRSRGSREPPRVLTLRQAPRLSTFGFLRQGMKVTQQPGLSLRGGAHNGPEDAAGAESPRLRPPVPRTRAAPGLSGPLRGGQTPALPSAPSWSRRRGETHPGANGAHGADPGGHGGSPGLKRRSSAAHCAGQ